MTLTLFNKLYTHYKRTFDYELYLSATKTTYAEAFAKSQKEQEWF